LVKAREWDVTKELFNAVVLPYAEVSPYWTCEVAGSFVDQDSVVPFVVVLEATTEEMVGGVVSGVVGCVEGDGVGVGEGEGERVGEGDGEFEGESVA